MCLRMRPRVSMVKPGRGQSLYISTVMSSWPTFALEAPIAAERHGGGKHAGGTEGRDRSEAGPARAAALEQQDGRLRVRRRDSRAPPSSRNRQAGAWHRCGVLFAAGLQRPPEHVRLGSPASRSRASLRDWPLCQRRRTPSRLRLDVDCSAELRGAVESGGDAVRRGTWNIAILPSRFITRERLACLRKQT